jgi:hypothetical protein
VFTRYTDIVVLGCAVVAVTAAWRLRMLPGAALGWWLGSVVLFAAGLATFDDLVYGGPLRSGYRPGEVTFSLGAIPRNLRFMPVHLMQALPALLLGLAGLAWIAARVTLGRAGGARAAVARRDLGVGLALAAPWCAVWGLYAAYDWTAGPGLSTLQAARFYVPALGAITLLGAWPLVRVPPRAWLAGLTPAVVAVVLAGLGLWAFAAMRAAPMGGVAHRDGPHAQVAPAARRAAAAPAGHDVPHPMGMPGTSRNAPAS